MKTLRFVTLGVLFCCSRSMLAADFELGNYTLINSTRINRTVYEYTYKVDVTNLGTQDTTVAANLASTTGHITIVDGVLNFGQVPVGETIRSGDTITLRHDRAVSFEISALVWTFQTRQIILRLNEVLFKPLAGNAPFIEIKNAGSESVALTDYFITNERRDTYQMPAGLSLPANGMALIVFDGQNRTDRWVIHATNLNFLDPSEGALTLASANGVPVDWITWGEDQTRSATGQGALAIGIEPGTTIGRAPRSVAPNHLEWNVYLPTEATPGAPNHNFPVRILLPLHGAVFESGSVQLNWYPGVRAARYRVQLASDDTFLLPIVDSLTDDPSFSTTPLAEGKYFWRVQAIAEDGSTADYSAPNVLIIRNSALGAMAGAPVSQSRILNVPRLGQHKDTELLLLECPVEFGQHAWNVDHQVLDETDPADMTCPAASIAMVNHFFGGNLSQDRINFEVLKDRPERPGSNAPEGPEGDLAYGAALSGYDIERAITYALGAAPTLTHITSHTQLDLLWDIIKTEIDAGRPLLGADPKSGVGHVIVVTGYEEGEGTRALWVNDPWAPAGRTYPIDLEAAEESTINFLLWRLPANPWPAFDEPEIHMDSDGDNVKDFDELRRFHTDPFDPDTDNDQVSDYADIRASAFDETYGYALKGSFAGLRQDRDHDGSPMELDRDSDGDFCSDGFEDFNFNGIYEPALSETHNFFKFDANCGGWSGRTIFELREPHIRTRAELIWTIDEEASTGSDMVFRPEGTATVELYEVGCHTYHLNPNSFRVTHIHGLMIIDFSRAPAQLTDLSNGGVAWLPPATSIGCDHDPVTLPSVYAGVPLLFWPANLNDTKDAIIYNETGPNGHEIMIFRRQKPQ